MIQLLKYKDHAIRVSEIVYVKKGDNLSLDVIIHIKSKQQPISLQAKTEQEQAVLFNIVIAHIENQTKENENE